MSKKLKYFLLHAAIVLSLPGFAQQDPIYAQYINNPLTINPAFAGSNNMFNASLQYRMQWAGIEANPTTVNFSSHIAVAQNKVGLGMMVLQDKLGDVKNTEFNTIYSYKLNLKNSTFSFGLQTGFIRYTSDPSLLTIRDAGDPNFNGLTETKFNTGFGVMLKSDRYIIGLSVPRMLPATISQGGATINLYQQNYYLFGSYVLFLSPDIRFKPSSLIRYTAGLPVSVDLNASFNFKELYTAGLFTRNFSAYGLMMQAIIKNIRLGYVIEVPGNSTSSLNFVSQEFSIGVSMGVMGSHDSVIKTF